MTKIIWYRHTHENRNDLLRYGLMISHKEKNISYIEKEIAYAEEAGFSQNVSKQEHRHLSFITIAINNTIKRIIVDNEDSFIHLSPLIKEADIYFTASFNSALFRQKTIPEFYNWQKDEDVKWYKEKLIQLIDSYSDQFDKIRPFVPIFDNLSTSRRVSYFQKKLDNLIFRLNKYLKGDIYWTPAFRSFNKRYANINRLRNGTLKYNVVLNDTLWGWPAHRIRLHRQLRDLQDKTNIYSSLSWHIPFSEDGGTLLGLKESDFPMIIGEKIVNYEEMLSQSKIGVFATGFHWGWRNIMTFALFIGIPQLVDKPLFEPYFDFNEFNLYYNESGEWNNISFLLDNITKEIWERTKIHNQKIFDLYLSPLNVANYFISSAIA